MHTKTIGLPPQIDNNALPDGERLDLLIELSKSANIALNREIMRQKLTWEDLKEEAGLMLDLKRAMEISNEHR